VRRVTLGWGVLYGSVEIGVGMDERVYFVCVGNYWF
jgi:hypothetical protein